MTNPFLTIPKYLVADEGTREEQVDSMEAVLRNVIRQIGVGFDPDYPAECYDWKDGPIGMSTAERRVVDERLDTFIAAAFAVLDTVVYDVTADEFSKTVQGGRP